MATIPLTGPFTSQDLADEFDLSAPFTSADLAAKVGLGPTFNANDLRGKSSGSWILNSQGRLVPDGKLSPAGRLT